jgi:hypothetical protein
METNFVLNSISEEGRRANEKFERGLKTELPLDLQLLEGLDVPEVTVAQLEKRAREEQQPNPWDNAEFSLEEAATSEDRPLSYADLAERRDPLTEMVARAVRAELKRHASNVELDEEEEEPQETPELPEDRDGTRFERDVEIMARCIQSRMSRGIEKAAAVQSLRKATSQPYSQGVIDAAAALVTA